MTKTRGMNYRKRKKLMIASLVLKSMFAVCLIYAFFMMIANMEILQAFYAIVMQMQDPETEILIEQINGFFIGICITIPVYIMLLFVLIAHNVKWMIKNKQQFFLSQTKIAIFQFVNVCSLFVCPISSILMIIASFVNDDGKPTKQRIRKTKDKHKKPKIKLSKSAKKQISSLKKERRRGIISQELYEKKVKKIIKNDGTN